MPQIKKAKEFYIGKDVAIEKFKSEFGEPKPCIWGCDSHGYDNLLEPSKDGEGQLNYCWVKADVTWNGLRQILYEPEERVCICQDNPEPIKSIHTIDKLVLYTTEVNRNLKVKGIEIDVNHNLVSIIGGRGSGKTAIMDIMASCFPEGKKLSNQSSFYSRLYSKQGNNGIKVELSTKSYPNAVMKDFCQELEPVYPHSDYSIYSTESF